MATIFDIPDVPDNYKPRIDDISIRLARAGDALMPILEELCTGDDQTFEVEGHRCIVTVRPLVEKDGC